MSHMAYLSELFSVQCEQAYDTLQRFKDVNGLSDAGRKLIVETQDILITLRDKIRATRLGTKEATDGKEGQG